MIIYEFSVAYNKACRVHFFFFYDFKTFFSFARCNHTFSSLLPLFTTLRPLLANAWHLLTRDSHLSLPTNAHLSPN